MSKARHPHGYYHSLQILTGKGFQWLLDIQMIGDAPDMMAVCCDGEIG